MSWMERLREALMKTSPMDGQQSAKKLWEIFVDKGVHNAMGGWFWDLRAAAKGDSPSFWQRMGSRISGGAGGAARVGGGMGRRVGGWGMRAMDSFIAKAPGRVGAGIQMGVGLANEARTTAIGLGKIGQLLLTGKGPRTSFADAFFPFFKTHSIGDPAKYALNPVIARRVMYAAAPIAVLSGMKEALRPAAPPPSVYFDGRYMRHINDMGASAAYGQKMMGPNSILNEGSRAQLLSQIGHLL